VELQSAIGMCHLVANSLAPYTDKIAEAVVVRASLSINIMSISAHVTDLSPRPSVSRSVCYQGAYLHDAYGPADVTATHCLLFQEIHIGFGNTFLVPDHPINRG